MPKKTKKAAIKDLARRPYRMKRFGIQNHFGSVWSPETFGTAEAAQKYLDKQRPGFGGLPKHRVVPVRVTVSIIR